MHADRTTQEFAAVHLRLDKMQLDIARLERNQAKEDASIAWLTKKWAAWMKRKVKK